MWDWIINALATCIGFFEGFIGDWGLAIILLTVIVRLLLLPLTLKQMKSTAEMQVVQPLLQEIQTKYADDPQRLNEEMMKFYSEHKFNPLAGCLPMIIQMPIFFALFSVLRNLPDMYPDATAFSFFSVLPDLTTSTSAVLGAGGVVAAIPYFIFTILFSLLTFLPMMMQKNSNSMTKGMGAVMAVMMLFVGWSSPAGVVLYWVTSSAWACVQQFIIFKKKDAEVEEQREKEIATKPVEVNVVRREHKPRPRKKG